MEADFVSDLATYLSQLTTNPNGVTNLEEVLNFTKSFPPEEYPRRGAAVWEAALALGFDNTSPEFWPYYQLNLEIAGPQGILGLLKNYSLDALMIPTDFAPDLPARVGTPIVTLPLGFYPYNTTVEENTFGNLVQFGPNIPYVPRI